MPDDEFSEKAIEKRVERCAEASGKAMAVVETEEMQTRLDHLYLFAEDIELAKDALRCMQSVFKAFKEHGPTQDKEAQVSTRDMLAASDATMKFYSLVNATLRKRTLTRAERGGNADATVKRLQEVQARIIELKERQDAADAG